MCMQELGTGVGKVKRINGSRSFEGFLEVKRLSRVILVLSITLLLMNTALGSDLMSNGDFEQPVVTKSAGWDIFNSSEIPGWTVQWSDTSCDAEIEPHLEIHRDVNSWTDISGAQYVEMDTDCGGPENSGGFSGTEKCNVKINQTIPLDEDYDCSLKFYYSPRPGHQDNQLKVFINGVQKGYYTADGSGESDTNWTEAEIGFNVNDDAEIAFEEVGTANSFGMFLDDVRVTCVVNQSISGSPTPTPTSTPDQTATPLSPGRVGGTSLHIDKLDLLTPPIVVSLLVAVAIACMRRR